MEMQSIRSGILDLHYSYVGILKMTFCCTKDYSQSTGAKLYKETPNK